MRILITKGKEVQLDWDVPIVDDVSNSFISEIKEVILTYKGDKH